ncbi:hypothetical protein JYU19_01985 [bacterium AH-315-J21]|nr:hypothetical protein [bacterium AH-315-J21]
MLTKLLKELFRQRKVLTLEILAIGVVLVVSFGTALWNLSLAQDVFAESNSSDTVSTLTTQVSSLQEFISSNSDKQLQTVSLQERIQQLPTKHGVVVKSLRRWEQVKRRKSTAMVSLELESSYKACVEALHSIESWLEIAITEITVEASSDNERFVVLSITLVDESRK